MKFFILSRLVYWLYRLWSMTWRLSFHEDPEFKKISQSPFIFGHWHQDELALLCLVPKYKIATMTSTSFDGSIIDHVIRKLGGATSRGSSTRGGVGALKGLIRLCRGGRSLSLAVDGPKGPIYEPKPGIFELSSRLNIPIVAISTWSSNSIFFKKSWNQTYFPKPFSRIRIVISAPIGIPNRSEVKSENWKEKLKTEIHRCQTLAKEI